MMFSFDSQAFLLCMMLLFKSNALLFGFVLLHLSLCLFFSSYSVPLSLCLCRFSFESKSLSLSSLMFLFNPNAFVLFGFSFQSEQLSFII